ncbi:MAG TPA: hypothetical protein VIU10_01750 [Candidatus Udaeobacter sp.]
MRKFKRLPLHRFRFRSLLMVAGASLLLAAFAPRANADLIAYFNFEGTPTPGYPVNLDSQVPPGAVSTTISTNYTPGDTSAESGIPLNVAPGDPDPNLTGLGLHASALNDPADFDIPLFSPTGVFQNMTVSFAVNVAGNGFSAVTLWYSIDGGVNFINSGNFVMLPNSGALIVSLAVPAAANNAPLLVLRLQFTGGQSSGTNLQDTIDNIQINGTIVPEPTTVAGGLLGVLGLCWHQRRRLIRSVRFRRT